MQAVKKTTANLSEVDQALVKLLTERARLTKSGLTAGESAPVLEAVYAEARALGSALNRQALENIYREILSACQTLRNPIRVAYLGPQGTFCEMALIDRFGHSAQAVACANIDEVVRTAETGKVDYAVVPIENSTQGTVTRTLDLLMNTALTIVGEVHVPVVHHLMGKAQNLKEIQRVCAHPQALAQCHNWLAAHLPGVELVPASSNAKAAQDASADSTLAAIAADRASELYGLTILASAIQDDARNRTRFLVLGHTSPKREDGVPMKTSVVFSTANVAGALFKALEPFYINNVSMAKLESRPARNGAWEYNFYVDLEGHIEDEALKAAVQQMKPFTQFFKLLGSYPRARDFYF